jgi:hypothetical protein
MGQYDAPRLARAVADNCSPDQCHGRAFAKSANTAAVSGRISDRQVAATTHAPKARLEIVNSASQGLAFAKADDCARWALSFLLEQCRQSLAFDHVCVGGASVAAGRFAMPSSTA